MSALKVNSEEENPPTIPYENRTRDFPITSPALYQLNYPDISSAGSGDFFLACEDFWENVLQFTPRLRFFFS